MCIIANGFAYFLPNALKPALDFIGPHGRDGICVATSEHGA
jgi:hypothetical protein